MENAGIVRNRLKIRSATSNAKAFIEVRKEFGSFSDYIWRFVSPGDDSGDPDGNPIRNNIRNQEDVPVRSELSDLISKDLKRRGFSFIGTTIVYAFLQAVGVVDDHEVGCFRKV